MAARHRAYVDTSAFIALVDRSDTYHPLFAQLFADPPRLLTTTLVVAEGHGWFLRRFDRTRALEFMALFDELTALEIVPVGDSEQRAAVALLRRYPDQDLTLTDAVGLEVMRRHAVASCWSTDFHLGLLGVPLAIHRR